MKENYYYISDRTMSLIQLKKREQFLCFLLNEARNDNNPSLCKEIEKELAETEQAFRYGLTHY